MHLFVTGTDTGVGKSVVTACLAQAGRARGTVRAVKPVETGVQDGDLGSDAVLIADAAGHRPVRHAVFVAPVSPHRAARLEGRSLPPSLLADVAGLEADLVLVEGVGGWCVPLGNGLWIADLARACGGAVIVVAADRLGVLNHTLLTVEAVRRSGLQVAGVVLDRGAAEPDDSRPYNLEDLRELLDVPVVALAPLDAKDPEARARAGHALLDGLFTPTLAGPCR